MRNRDWMRVLKPSFGQFRGPLLIGVLVFLATLAPVVWLSVRMRHQAADRDYERLNGLAVAVMKSLNDDSMANQRMLHSWRKHISALGGPLDETAWRNLFDGTESNRLGQFRSVGLARRDANGRWIVGFSEGRNADERIPSGTDLAEIPTVRSAADDLAAANNREIVSAKAVDLLGIGPRNFAMVRLPDQGGGQALLFATVVASDHLTPASAVWIRKRNPGDPEESIVRENRLPGTAEELLTVESIPPGGEVPVGRFPEFKWDFPFGRMHLLFRPGPDFARDSLRGEAWILLGGGSAVAGLLAAMVLSQARQREIMRTRVDNRTAELREANAELGRFRAMIETTGDLVGLAEADGKPIFMNRAGRDLLGIGPDESLAEFTMDRIHFPETLELFAREGIPHAMEHGSWSAEFDMRHRDGHRIPVSFEGVIIRSSADDPGNLGMIACDISVSRNLALQLRQSLEHERELVALKSQFVNTVSHEFRTPLGVIMSSTDILSHYLDRLTDEARREHLVDIFSSCKHMSKMLEQVLDLGSIEVTSVSCNGLPLDLPALLSRIIDESASATRGGPIRFDPGPDLDGAIGDETLIRHIFLNLISNARKYSPVDAEVELAVHREQTEAIITVRDHGIGIPIADQPRLFESFSRGSNVSDTPGSGLGLAIVKRSALLHGGSVTIDSAEDQGTLVTVRLPFFP